MKYVVGDRRADESTLLLIPAVDRLAIWSSRPGDPNEQVAVSVCVARDEVRRLALEGDVGPLRRSRGIR
jgi:hypothetical protein